MAKRRGGGWVAAQFVMLAVVAVVAPATSHDAATGVRIAAALMAAAAIALGCWAAALLGRSFTPFPRPVAQGRLCREGPYRWMRHPIYAGVLLGVAAWALWWESIPAALLVPVVFVFFALKARAEERWLAAAYPDYPDYARRVKAIVPFIY